MNNALPQFHPVMPDPLAQIPGTLGWIEVPTLAEDTHYIAAQDTDNHSVGRMQLLARVTNGHFVLPSDDDLKRLEGMPCHIECLTYELSDVVLTAVNQEITPTTYAIEATVPQQNTPLTHASIPGYTPMPARQVLAHATYHAADHGYELEHTIFGVPKNLREVCALPDILVATWAYWGRAECSLAFLDAEVIHVTHAATIDELIDSLGLTVEGKLIRAVDPAFLPAQRALQQLLIEQQHIMLKIEAGVVLEAHEHQLTLQLDSTGCVVGVPTDPDQELALRLATLHLNQALIAAQRLIHAPACLVSTPGIQTLACEASFARAASVACLPLSATQLVTLTQPRESWSAQDAMVAARLEQQRSHSDEATMRKALERGLHNMIWTYEPASLTYSIDPAASTFLVETGVVPVNLLPTVTALPTNLTQTVVATRSHRARLYEMMVRMQTLLFAQWACAACPQMERVISVCGKSSNQYLCFNAQIDRLTGVQEVFASLLVTADTRRYLRTPLRGAYEGVLDWHAYSIDPQPCKSDWPAFESHDYDEMHQQKQTPVRLRHEHLNFSYHRNAPNVYRMNEGLYNEENHLKLSALQQSVLSSAQERFDALYAHPAGLQTDLNRRKTAETCTKIHKLLRVAFAPIFKPRQTSYLSFSTCATYHLYQQRVCLPAQITFVPYTLVDLCVVMMDIYEALELYQAARSLMPALLRLAPGDPDLYLQCANLCASMQEFDMATQYIDEAEPYIFCDDHVWAAYTGRAHIAMAQRKLPEAYAWQLLADEVTTSPISQSLRGQIEQMLHAKPYADANEAREALMRLGKTLLPLESTMQTVCQHVHDLVNARLYGDAEVILTELNTVHHNEEMLLLTHSLLRSELGRELKMHEKFHRS